MNHNCKCGGRLLRSDLRREASPKAPGGYWYVDTDPLIAHFKCDRCGVQYQQRKRQAKPKLAPVLAAPSPRWPVLHYRSHTGRVGDRPPTHWRVWRTTWASDQFEIIPDAELAVLKKHCTLLNVHIDEALDD